MATIDPSPDRVDRGSAGRNRAGEPIEDRASRGPRANRLATNDDAISSRVPLDASAGEPASHRFKKVIQCRSTAKRVYCYDCRQIGTKRATPFSLGVEQIRPLTQ